jgi:hypothetical protein
MEPTSEQLTELARILAATSPEEIDCGELLDRVATYLELHDAPPELPAELLAVRQHLAICPQCQEEFDALVRAQSADD